MVTESELRANGEGRRVMAPSGSIFEIKTVEEEEVQMELQRTPDGGAVWLANKQRYSVEEVTTFEGWRWAT